MSKPECLADGNTVWWDSASWDSTTGFRGICGICGDTVVATECPGPNDHIRITGSVQISNNGPGGSSVNVAGNGNTVIVNGRRRS